MAYTPETRRQIRHYVAQLQQEFDSFRFDVDADTDSPELPHLRLSRLTGTVPYRYRDQVYDQPIEIWFLPDFPVAKPVVLVPSALVSSADGVRIVPNHPHVTPSGKLQNLRCLDEWSRYTMLAHLVREMQVLMAARPIQRSTRPQLQRDASAPTSSTTRETISTGWPPLRIMAVVIVAFVIFIATTC